MITIENLCKRRGQRLIVDDVTFTARPGRVTGFLGPNGAGKSSTLRILLGLDRATSGTAVLNGVPYWHLHRPLTVVGALVDGCGAHRSRTGKQHLEWVAQAGGLPRRRVTEVLEEVELTPHAKHRVGSYSLGMNQRLGLAAALLGKPEVLVLDEPMNGLDPAGMEWMRRLVRHHADTGGTVLLSSHHISDIADIADDVVVMHHGSMLLNDSVDAVAASYGSLEAAFFALTESAGGVR